MAKSNTTTVFQIGDGKKAIFYQSKFKREVDKRITTISRETRRVRGAKAAVFRMIAEELRHPRDKGHLESTVKLVTNWYSRSNGPSNLEDIRALARILEMDNEDAFLKEINESEEDKKVNAPVSDMVNVNLDQNRLIVAMRQMKEKEVAYELYSVFVDLMGSYLKSDLAVWFECEEGTPEWAAALASFPKRLPVECAIQKAKMYLSEDTILKAYNLLESMYGPKFSEAEEPSEYKSVLAYRTSGFCSERYEMYAQYLEDRGIKKDSERNIRDDDWNDFVIELNESWWDKIEEAFDEYLP